MIDVERLVTTLLRGALHPVPVQNTVADDDLGHPLVLVSLSSGAAVQGLHDLLWRHTLDLICFSPARADAKALALTAYSAAHAMHSAPNSTPGYVCSVSDQLTPTEVRTPDQPSDQAQFVARFTVVTRA